MTLQRIPLCSFSRRLHLDTATDEYAVSQADLDSTHHFIYNSGKVTGTTSVSIYENPFRQIDVSSFPLDLQQRLQQLPIMTQIAILKVPPCSRSTSLSIVIRIALFLPLPSLCDAHMNISQEAENSTKRICVGVNFKAEASHNRELPPMTESRDDHILVFI